MKKLVFISVVCFAFLQGCSKGTPEQAPVTPVNPKPAEIAKKAVEPQSAPIVKADKNIPLTQYQELNSGKQLLFTYLTLSTMPVEFEKISETISEQYRRESDEFKKRDILTALKPGIESEIAKAKNSRYFFIDVDASLDKYDFGSKSFSIPELAESSAYRYFFDVSSYRLTFTNPQAFSKLQVPDETQARNIESLRAKYSAIKVRVYFFAADTKLGETVVQGEITKVKVMDAKGNTLAEI